MTKDELVKKYARVYEVTQVEATKQLDKLSDFIVDCVKEDDCFKLHGLFEIVKEVDTRTEVSNPQTGGKSPNKNVYKLKVKTFTKLNELKVKK